MAEVLLTRPDWQWAEPCATRRYGLLNRASSLNMATWAPSRPDSWLFRRHFTSKMLVKEYRILLPLTVDEYRIAQLFMIQARVYISLLFDNLLKQRIFSHNVQLCVSWFSLVCQLCYNQSSRNRMSLTSLEWTSSWIFNCSPSAFVFFVLKT